jgi:hypothetical protein
LEFFTQSRMPTTRREITARLATTIVSARFPSNWPGARWRRPNGPLAPEPDFVEPEPDFGFAPALDAEDDVGPLVVLDLPLEDALPAFACAEGSVDSSFAVAGLKDVATLAAAGACA